MRFTYLLLFYDYFLVYSDCYSKPQSISSGEQESALFASIDFASKTIVFLKLKSGIKILGLVWFYGFLKSRQEDDCPASC